MANMHLVTGRAGEKHVSAADEGALNTAVFGKGQYVLNEGSKMAATVISNNAVRIADGAAMFNGRYIRLEGYEDLTIESGSQGTYRNDLIVIRYTRDISANTESAKLVVIKGTASSTAVDPVYVSGNILEGAVQADMPLYRIPLDNVNIGTPVALFEMIEDNVGDLRSKQNDTKNLTDSATLSDGDYFPFYDVSASGNRKTLWSNMIAKIKTAIWGTTNGFVKADGSGGISGVSTIPIANGGTGATTAEAARTNLGAAAVVHKHTAAEVGAAELDEYGKVKASQTCSRIKEVSTETMTLTAADVGCMLMTRNANATGQNYTITLPAYNNVPFPAGAEFEILRYYGGTVTIKADDDCYLYAPGAIPDRKGQRITINSRFGVCVLKKAYENYWIASGDVSIV